ncbi:MAG TPA: hypothetical protein VF604_04405 [Pyrinomonadaceae bacterium]|jgi:hypothetical protein
MKKTIFKTLALMACLAALQIFASAQDGGEIKVSRNARKKITAISNMLGGDFEGCMQPPKVYRGLIASVDEDKGNIESFKMRAGKRLRTITPGTNSDWAMNKQAEKNEFLVRGKKVSVTVYVCGDEKKWLADEMKVIK